MLGYSANLVRRATLAGSAQGRILLSLRPLSAAAAPPSSAKPPARTSLGLEIPDFNTASSSDIVAFENEWKSRMNKLTRAAEAAAEKDPKAAEFLKRKKEADERKSQKEQKELGDKIKELAKARQVPPAGNHSPLRALVDAKMDLYPTKSIVSFRGQKIRWNVQEMKRHSEAYGTALRDLDYLPGDTIVLALQGGSAEFVIAALGAAYAGVKVVPVNVHTITEDKLHEVLTKTQPKGLVFTQSSSPDKPQDVLKIVRKLVPELAQNPLQFGLFFVSPKYTNLKFAVHTGFDRQRGIHRYKDLMMYNPMFGLLDEVGANVNAQTEWLVSPDNFSTVTQGKVIEIAEKAATSLNVSKDSQLCLAAANENIQTAALVGTLVALSHASHLLIPSQSFDEGLTQTSSQETHADKAIGDKKISNIKASWWEKVL